MGTGPLWRQWEESADVLGRLFVLLIEGPGPDGRYDVRVWEGARGRGARPYLRAPIRGRDAEEARDRALEVLHNYVGLDQFRLLAEAVAAELAPGAAVEITENARQVVVALGPPYTLRPPLSLSREMVLGRAVPEAELRAMIRKHMETHLAQR